MTYISYMLQPEDKDRVREVLTRLAPGMGEHDAFRIMARCSSWSEDQLLGDWPEGLTISSDRKAEVAWRQTEGETSARVAGLSAASSMSSLVDLVIAGLFHLDQEGAMLSNLSLPTLVSIATRLRKQASPTRTLVSSSIGLQGVAELCGREKVMVMSPGNQRDLLSAAGRVDERQSLPWLILQGRLDPVACRALWRACEDGEDPARAAGFSMKETSDPEGITGMLEGKTPVFFSRQDYRDMTGDGGVFSDTLFLDSLVPGARGNSRSPTRVRGMGHLHQVSGIGQSKDRIAAESMSGAFLRIVSEAVRAESKWHPPGSLARAVRAGGRLPVMCGPELTN